MLKPFVGKLNEISCLEFWKEVSKRFIPATAKYKFNTCTDGNKQNLSALQIAFQNGTVNYSKVKKIRNGDIVIGMINKCILGNMPKEEIGIRHIDGFCARLRERVSRYCRKSKTFSKKKTPFYLHLFKKVELERCFYRLLSVILVVTLLYLCYHLLIHYYQPYIK
ncbi:hypothetical protein J4434_01925 [Candidatus Woesearchaeota archaeon]|nr:hypothetical protein [Candidatus Woesearchaeota archaeon]